MYDNFLFIPGDGGEELHLIDWEYAGMHDPHIDIAMFCIYAFYDREQVDRLIDLYFPEGCADAVRVKIYGYIAACGRCGATDASISACSAWSSANTPCASINMQRNTIRLSAANVSGSGCKPVKGGNTE